jgi:hypothetical protein
MAIKRLLSIVLAVSMLAIAAPAHAEPSKPDKVNPYLAWTLSTVLPIGTAYLAAWQKQPNVGLVLSTASLGAGHIYAGDPLRGGLVTLGGGAILAGGGILIQQAIDSDRGKFSNDGTITTSLLVGGVVVAYWLWAGHDAFDTAVRHNKSVSEEWHAPVAVP